MKTSGKSSSELSDNIKEEISVPEGLSSKWATFSEAAVLTERAESSNAKQSILRASINRVK